ncbi:hypothetical protein I79_014495 [Cricetulus griseus]|uniref:Uncharacterized protein n=1 Tax=Cricetulus griseus TaxID=10029 RepID=G3HU87_CRIGR|nr:hypothetical protein I79_014495 [Cricetulus griseus]
MKMIQKMKKTLVAELTQMDHLQNDKNQHLSNSFYEIKTATKLSEMLYICNPSYFRDWGRRIESWSLACNICQDIASNKRSRHRNTPIS